MRVAGLVHTFFENVASAELKRRAGRTNDYLSMNLGDRTRWFSYGGQRVQWLAVAAGGEGGFTIGVVRVDFSGGLSCSYYDAPRVTVEIYPRQWDHPFTNGGPGGMLRRGFPSYDMSRLPPDS